jgi:dsDNA-specific endonuclease/ATPase MutS2
VSDEITKIYDLSQENQRLKEELEKAKQEIERLRNRNAGRKKSFNQNDINTMNYMRETGKSYREIAEHFGCSKTTIIEYLVHREGAKLMEQEEVKVKKKGILGYNYQEERYGILNNLDLWEISGLHCGATFQVLVDDTWINDRIDMANDEWYLVKC